MYIVYGMGVGGLTGDGASGCRDRCVRCVREAGDGGATGQDDRSASAGIAMMVR